MLTSHIMLCNQLNVIALHDTGRQPTQQMLLIIKSSKDTKRNH